MDAYWAMVLKHETGLYASRTTKRLIMTISCDVTMFHEGQILPVVIVANETGYKLTEAKVVKQNVLTMDVELNMKEGKNFNPLFDLMQIDFPLYKVMTHDDVKHIPGYLDYRGLECLHIGSHYRR